MPTFFFFQVENFIINQFVVPTMIWIPYFVSFFRLKVAFLKSFHLNFHYNPHSQIGDNSIPRLNCSMRLGSFRDDFKSLRAFWIGITVDESLSLDLPILERARYEVQRMNVLNHSQWKRKQKDHGNIITEMDVLESEDPRLDPAISAALSKPGCDWALEKILGDSKR